MWAVEVGEDREADRQEARGKKEVGEAGEEQGERKGDRGGRGQNGKGKRSMGVCETKDRRFAQTETFQKW